MSKPLAALFIAQMLATGATTVSVSLASILVSRLAGTESLAGLPASFTMLATAFFASTAGALMAKYGRRRGLVTGYIVGAFGAFLAGWQALEGHLIGFFIGGILVGIANSFIQQGRYAAADLVTPKRRGRIVGYVLSFSAGGSFLATSFTPALRVVGERAGVPELELGWFLGAVFLIIGGLVLASFLPKGSSSTIARNTDTKNIEAVPTVIKLLGSPIERAAIVSLVLGQSIMVMLMILTPVHAKHLGHAVPAISAVLSIHFFGMYGFAWLTGHLVERFSAQKVILGGAMQLATASIIFALTTGTVSLGVALFLLGLGWNWCFVSGSTLLSQRFPQATRARLQGAVEQWVWLAAAFSAVGGGILRQQFGFLLIVLLSVLASTLILLSALLASKGTNVSPVAN